MVDLARRIWVCFAAVCLVCIANFHWIRADYDWRHHLPPKIENQTVLGQTRVAAPEKQPPVVTSQKKDKIMARLEYLFYFCNLQSFYISSSDESKLIKFY
jgi:hypothetical protein